MEENFSMEWNMEWKIFRKEWKWKGKKLPVWNTEKSTSISFYCIPCPDLMQPLTKSFEIGLILATHQVDKHLIFFPEFLTNEIA